MNTNNSEIVFLNTMNNTFERNFTNSKTLEEAHLAEKSNKGDQPLSINDEWQNHHFVYKMVRLDLFDDEIKDRDHPNLSKIY